jgi:hypothetical protein
MKKYVSQSPLYANEAPNFDTDRFDTEREAIETKRTNKQPIDASFYNIIIHESANNTKREQELSVKDRLEDESPTIVDELMKKE